MLQKVMVVCIWNAGESRGTLRNCKFYSNTLRLFLMQNPESYLQSKVLLIRIKYLFIKYEKLISSINPYLCR